MMLRTVRQLLGRSRLSMPGLTSRGLASQHNPDDTIYVLGIGNLGKYVAHSLLRQTSKSVTLLFHRPSLEEQWRSQGSCIQCITDGVTDTTSGFGVEVLPASPTSSGVNSRPADLKSTIKHLIVATKTYATAGALELVKSRLNATSSILFLQNGMGTMDEVSAEIFPDPKTRPAYWAGICSAGVYSVEPFKIVHAGKGPLMVGLVEEGQSCVTGEGNRTSAAQNGMIQRLLETSVLETTLLSPADIKAAQLQKLVVNSIINPLTAIFRCRNGQLVDNAARLAVMKLLLEEAGPIARALVPNISDRFSDEKLLDFVCTVARKTGANTSSMLQDVQAGRRTEIDYINGYLVAQGRILGLPHTHNANIVRLVKEQRAVQDRDVEAQFGLTEER